MNRRTLESSRNLLEDFYVREKGLIAFVDESYRGNERENEFPFYIVTGVVFEAGSLAQARQGLSKAAKGSYWHTTESYRLKDFDGIHEMIEAVAKSAKALIVCVQLDIGQGGLETSRRECLLQITSSLTGLGCNLMIYETRNHVSKKNADAALFQRAKGADLIPIGTRQVQSHPAVEPLLWAPDLASWCLRQILTRSDERWFEGLLGLTHVIDVAVSSPEYEKRPETAAALNSGPALPGAPEEEKVDRSSVFIMHNYQRQLQDILHNLPNSVEPLLPPAELRSWLTKTFPD